MNFSYYPYELKGLSKPSHGALLRLDLPNQVFGYADCHPCEDWGDLPLSEQLNLLSENRTNPLTRRALAFASIDASARVNHSNLFQGLNIPQSHCLIPNLATWKPEDGEKALEEGFTCFKVKLGKKLATELPLLKELFKLKAKVRLDFNQCLTFADFDQFLKTIAPSKEQIDFIEDPIPFDAIAWKGYQSKYGIPLACDRESQKALGNAQAASVVVFKPAIQHEEIFFQRLDQKQRLVITSYLDHPLGQLAAAYIAAKCLEKLPKQVDLCGLLTHRVYQPNEFSDLLSSHGPSLTPPEGTGFGFDSLLADLPWKPLTKQKV